MAKHEILTGNKYGKLTVIKEVGKNKDSRYLWECQCECGNKTITNSALLKNGTTKSCGCIKKNHFNKNKEDVYQESLNAPHGLSLTPLYNVWQTMKSRCYNPNQNSYKLYGERGVTVCNEWKNNFKNFYDWSFENGYDGMLTLDRIDSNGIYEPNNCRWSNMKEQSNNTRRNKWITYKGETKTMIQWSECLNIPYATLRARIYRGWDTERTFNQPWQ